MKFIAGLFASFALGMFAVLLAAVTMLCIVAFLSLIPEPRGVQWPVLVFMTVVSLAGITGLGAFLKHRMW